MTLIVAHWLVFTMKHHVSAFFVAWASVTTARLFSESIGAQGLLGSHFGVPGLAAAYDYVVIGGGTAGLTVARRLAANASVTVAVIEAGDFYEFSNGNFSEVPAYASQFTGNNPTQKNPFLDWYQYTEPQPVSRCFFFAARIDIFLALVRGTDVICFRRLAVRDFYTTLEKCSAGPAGGIFCGKYGQ